MGKGILAKKRLRTVARPKRPTAVVTPAPHSLEVAAESGRDSLRRRCVQLLRAECLIPGSRTSTAPEALAFLLGCSYLKIWRWLHSDLWLPRFEEVNPILDVIEIIRRMRKGAQQLVAMKDQLTTLPADSGSVFFAEGIWNTLRNGRWSAEEKIEAITRHGLRLLKRRCEARAKET